jgi:hypothetical protein
VLTGFNINAINHGILRDSIFNLSYNKIIRAIRNKAKDGSKMEKAICLFMDELCENSGSIIKATENFIAYIYEFWNKIREIDIPIGSEITGLSQLMKFIPKELKLIDEQTICKEIIRLFADRYSTLLPTQSDKLLACTSYANMLISTRDFNTAIAILLQQINILNEYLPLENRYPLVVLFESLANCYSALQKNSTGNRAYALSYQQQKNQCWQKALRVVETIPHAFLKRSELLYNLNYYDSAIKLLEENNCTNCTLCNSYFYKALNKSDDPEEMRFFLSKMFYVQKHVAFCGTSCYAEKLYMLGEIFSNQKKPQIKYNLLAFFVDKSNKKATSDTASVNCSLLSDFFHNKHRHWLAEYFLKNSAKFAIKSRNASGLTRVYLTYFIRANIEKEADSYKHELVKQHSKWLLQNFTNTAKFYYGKEVVSISDVSQLIFNEVDESVCRLTSEKKNSVNELLLISLSRKMNPSDWWYTPLKWKRIKSDLRREFFYNLIFNFPEQGFLNFKKERPFILIHNLTEKIEALLAEHNICGAEDLLFETMDKAHPYNFLPFCRHFYYRLGLFSDKCLLDANFSREEIVDGLRETERRFGPNSEHGISVPKTNHSKIGGE